MHTHTHTQGEDKYTFVEDVSTPRSVTILVKGKLDNQHIHIIHTLLQVLISILSHKSRMLFMMD